MTSGERVGAALVGERHDRVPVADMCALSAANVLGYQAKDVRFDVRRSVKVALDFNRMIRSDIITAPLVTPAALCMDLGIVVVLLDDGHAVVASTYFSTPEKVESLELYDPADLHASRYLRAGITDKIALLHKIKPAGLFTTGWTWGPFTAAGALRGLEVLLMDMLTEPELARKVIVKAAALIDGVIRLQLDSGNDGMFVSEPSASPALISASTYDGMIAPATSSLFAAVRSYQVPGLLHICGDTTSLLPILPGLGVDCFGVDHAVDLSLAAKAVGGQMALLGNVDPVRELGRGTPASVMMASTACIHQAEGGRFILAPGCEVPIGAPCWNVKALVEASRRFDYR